MRRVVERAADHLEVEHPREGPVRGVPGPPGDVADAVVALDGLADDVEVGRHRRRLLAAARAAAASIAVDDRPVARAAAHVARERVDDLVAARRSGCGRAAPWRSAPCPACSSRTGSRSHRGTRAGPGAGPRAGVRPSSVVTARPATSWTGSRQDSIGSPSTSTVQLPQPPWRQPSLTDVWPSWLRSDRLEGGQGADHDLHLAPGQLEADDDRAMLAPLPCRPDGQACGSAAVSPRARVGRTRRPSSVDTSRWRRRR